ncbi:aspartyl-tRNA(Asn)/glutamyl-tRNA(Gln) amidotransferase subunit A [Amycolatopsis bartoniae]|uniref:Amidohydrolase n=1 Tax=Amycolatopsis bartoniae TaxID=941986 RepID=A0A8H9IZW5_9PSEU|nr:amidase [Amycolatopsis bartoniae]MBB2939365.1 aspartyl-tRNA(Asn)/glutamyl-tRNA(Gln) amidotransferase subunit A [Amycolatopsis bartoniae]TVT06712.1 amidase [Amycolatopsis bartoniae]GHF83564.1 amidohydrolase [Amycolatopsis bartoniae]
MSSTTGAESLATGAGRFAELDLRQLGSDLRARRVSSIELVEESLSAAARWEPRVNAFVTLDERGARDAARQADRELASGLVRGPLHGVPVAVKDMIDVRGLPTTAGSRHRRDHLASTDAACVRRLRDAGAVIVGKTATHEFANGPTGDRAASGPTRNPHAVDHMAGGSSSGSAAAIAAGIVPLALGTDTGGSARIPAALCGIVGLRPTYGALSTKGVLPLSASLDTVGVMARSAEDAAVLWAALSTAHSTNAPRADAPAPRLGWVLPGLLHPTSQEVVGAVRGRVDGLVTGEVVLPEAEQLRSAYAVIQGREAFAVHRDRLESNPELYDAEVRDRLLAGATVTVTSWSAALAVRERVRAVVSDLFDTYDFLALPTTPMPAPVVGARAGKIDGHPVDIRAALLSLTSPWSVLGLPAMSVPVGHADGLPIGLQLVGPPGSEATLLRTAAAMS